MKVYITNGSQSRVLQLRKYNTVSLLTDVYIIVYIINYFKGSNGLCCFELRVWRVLHLMQFFFLSDNCALQHLQVTNMAASQSVHKDNRFES